MFYQNSSKWDGKGGSEVKSTYLTWEDLGSFSQHLHGGSQTITPVSGNPTPSSDLLRHICDTHSYIHACMHACIQAKNLTQKSLFKMTYMSFKEGKDASCGGSQLLRM